MSWRYYKRIPLLPPFLYLNISKSGISLTIGVRGLRFTIGPRGKHISAGIPGSGISYRKRIK